MSWTVTTTGTPAPTVTCFSGMMNQISSPHTFPIGTTVVNCFANNTCGSASCTFTVTVTDNQPPVFAACAPDISAPQTSPAGAVVSYPTPTANDNCGPIDGTCNPPSGSTFGVGTTLVTCTAVDGHGLAGTCSFHVVVTPLPPDTCLQPDNGHGTVDLPPVGCDYLSPDQVHMIIDGLPPGTEIHVSAIHERFFNITSGPGGILGGERETFTSSLRLHLTGTGLLAGYSHDMLLPAVQCETHVGPRLLGTSPQSFDTEMFKLNGDLPPGDPDFDLLRISAGKGNGLPSPGHTTLTQLSPGNWRVDSFFDITYTIEFTSHPGGALGAMPIAGTTLGRIRMLTGSGLQLVCQPDISTITADPAGVIVDYLPPTAAGRCAPITVSCNPPSGSVFPVGATAVICTANDSCGNSATCSFAVTVHEQDSDGDGVPDSQDGCPNDPNKTSPGACGCGSPDTDVNNNGVPDCLDRPEHWFPSPLLPPPQGEYVSPQRFHQLYANGIILSNVSHRKFTQSFPPPPPMPGMSDTHSFDSEVTGEVSVDGGQTWMLFGAPAQVTVRITASGGLMPPFGTIQTPLYDTEMLQLDLSGGSLPAGFRLRESPTLQSTGQTTVRQAEGGGYRIGSFFDIFTEISLDDGANWSPGQGSTQVALQMDPRAVPPIPAPTPILPPPVDLYVSPALYHILTAQGIVIRDVKHKIFTQSLPPPEPGVRSMHHFDSQVDMEVSQDGGATFQPVRSPAAVTVAMELRSIAADGTRVYDTEMLQLDISGGGLPPTVMIRESPSLPSRGGTALTPQADGTYRIGSFFDIFPEVSVDGGVTWAAVKGPAHVELICDTPALQLPNPNLPPLEGQYVSPEEWHALYAQGIIISNVIHKRFTQTFPPPPPGASETHSFGSEVECDFSLNNGQDWQHGTIPAQVTVRLTDLASDGTTRYFETEMLALSLSGGVLPGGVMVRESPSKASLGRTSIRQVPLAGSFDIQSFFDIFTELSTDGGQTWEPSLTGPATVHLVAGVPQLSITCPADMTVLATQPPNAPVVALVNYPVPTGSGGCPPVSVNCMPPPGAFPVGVTVVTCTASDACGQTAACEFRVTVRRPTLQERVDAASPGDVLLVDPDNYPCLHVNKALTLAATGPGVVVHGCSPALTVSGCPVVAIGFVFTTATDDPTVLVQAGGCLILNNCVVEESTGGFDQVGIKVEAGGVLDLSSGNNAVNINGAGSLLRNESAAPVPAIGTTWSDNFVVMSSNFAIEDEIYHALDAAGSGLVTWVGGNVYVTPSSESIQRGIDAVPAGGRVNVASGAYPGDANATGNAIVLAPGESPGLVVINGNLILDGNDRLEVELNGTTAGTDYDQLVVNGTVVLGGAILSATAGVVIPDCAQLRIINNDNADPVGGTFAGLANGAPVVISGQPFRVYYDKGNGNDVILLKGTLTLPTVPPSYEVRVAACGGVLAGRHLAGIAIDPVAGNVYVALDTGPGVPASFDLARITPAGVISPVGTYAFPHINIVNMEWGPGGGIYVYDGASRIVRIDPGTGVTSVYSTPGAPIVNPMRYGMEFNAAGQLIFMPEGDPNSMYRVNTPAGVTFLGSYTRVTDEHGDSFGIQPDGDYVIYNDMCGSPQRAFELSNAGHVDGTPFTLRLLTSTDAHTLGQQCQNSNGAIDPTTGDVYDANNFGGLGVSRVLFTPGNVGPAATTTVFVDKAGNGLLDANARGITDLDFGPRSDTLTGKSLYYLDDFNDAVYEVRFAPINSAPTATCPAPLAVQCPGSQTLAFQALDADGDALSYEIIVDGSSAQTGTIPAGGPPTFATITFAFNYAPGSHAVSFSVNDGSLSGSCSTTVTVADTINPVIVCPPDITQCNDPGRCNAVVSWPAPAASDNCPGVGAPICSPASGSTFLPGTTTVTCTVSDAAGLTASCSFNVTVRDCESPTIVCPPDLTVNANNLTACLATGVSIGTPTTADNCGVSSVSNDHPSSTYPVGTTIVTWTVIDTSGNPARCQQMVTVIEPVPPMITCVDDVTVDCGSDTSPTGTGSPTAMDNCDPNPSISHVDQVPIEILPLSLGSWALATQNGGGATLVNGPGAPPLLTGSLHLTVGNDGTGVGEGRNSGFPNTLLSALTELNYWAYRTAPGGDAGNDVMIVLNIDTDGNGSDDDVIFFEPRFQRPATGNPALPDQGAIVSGTWQKWNALKGGWYSRNHSSVASPGVPGGGNAGVQPLSVYIAAFPNARIVNNAGGGGVHLAAGSGLGAWQNFDGSADAFTIGVGGVSRTYDFELTPGLDCTVTKIKQVIIRVWTATDSSGNQNSCSQIIQVRDNTPPTLTAGPIASCYPTVADAETAAKAATTADDHGCAGTLTHTASTVGDCNAVVTVTVTDECGNSASVAYNTRIDNTAPVVTTAAGTLDRTLECSDAAGIAAALAQAPAATDNCTLVPTIHLVGDTTVPTAGCPSGYVRTRTWNFTDECGNTSANFVQVITVRDTTAPVLVGTCPANITVACTHGGGEVVTFASPVFTDNCDAAPVVTCTPPSGSTFAAGTTAVTCGARDNCGNNSLTCSFTVTVTDTVRPTITCPPDALVQCPDPTDPAHTGTATSSDNCDLSPTISFVDAPPIEVTAGTPNGWSLRTTSTGVAGYVNGPGSPPLPSGSVRLAVGNDSGALAEARLTGFDGTRLADLTELAYSAYRSVVPVGGVNEDIVLILEVANDGGTTCNDVLIFEPEWQGTPVVHATWQRWNAHAGKWWSQFNPAIGGTRGAGVKPLSAYLAAFPNAKICGAGGLSGVALRAGLVFGAWRNFDGNADFFSIGVNGTSRSYNFEATPGNQCPTLSIIIRTWTATDDSGNQISCSQAIIVQDTVAPVLAGCANISKPNDHGLCSAVVTFAPTATDACSGPAAVTCVPPSGSAFPVGSTAVTCSATDACNNTGTCTFTVTVNDTEVPVANCPTNIVQPNDPGQCSAVVAFMASASDNCPGATVSCLPSSGSAFPVGTTIVTCRATDVALNTSVCSFSVTVRDTQPPLATCPAPISVSNDPNQCSAVVSYTATATDNCPGVGIVCVPAGGSSFPVGVTTVTCTATDAAGNTALCNFTVTVRDTQPPVANCPAPISVPADAGQCSAVVTYTATASDNCPNPTIVCAPPSGAAFPVGLTLVACTATDASGNTAACTFSVTVSDTQPPTATCPADITVGNDPNQCSAVVTYTATASDNCPGSSIACAPPSGSTFPLGATPVTCTATDAAGLTASCNFTVTVNDTQAPVANCPANIVVPNDAGMCSALVNYTATASDNCGSAVRVSIYSGFTLTDGGAPYSGLVGTFTAPGITFGTDTGFNWHPFGMSDFGADITGTLVVASGGSYGFTLGSDDGSLLFIDGNLVVDNGDPHGPADASGTVVLTAGTHTFEVQFFECCGGPSGVDLALPPGVTYGPSSATIACAPPSGSTFPVGTTTVNCTATDAVGLTGTCSFTVTVRDVEPPVIGTVTATQGGNVKNCAATVLQGPVAITVTATDQCPLTPPTVVLVNGANIESATFISEAPAGTFNYVWPVTATTANGTWTATVTATDAGANTDTEVFTLCVNKTQITGLVQLESFLGTGTVPTPHTRTVTFVATDGPGAGATVLKTWVLPLSNVSGDTFNYTLTDVPAGTTHLSAKTDWNKRRKLAASFDIFGQAVVNFTGANMLRGGDITGDNIVNLADYSSLVFHWLEVVSAVPAAAVADMNGDGVINFFDYVILGTNWFTVGDPQ